MTRLQTWGSLKAILRSAADTEARFATMDTWFIEVQGIGISDKMNREKSSTLVEGNLRNSTVDMMLDMSRRSGSS